MFADESIVNSSLLISEEVLGVSASLGGQNIRPSLLFICDRYTDPSDYFDLKNTLEILSIPATIYSLEVFDKFEGVKYSTIFLREELFEQDPSIAQKMKARAASIILKCKEYRKSEELSLLYYINIEVSIVKYSSRY